MQADKCECGGRWMVYSTRIKGRNRFRYLQCSKCARKPDFSPVLIPIEYAPRESAHKQDNSGKCFAISSNAR